ncbi:MAG: hypothetical protein SPE03_03765 [Treponema sp.]|nr:hypothetical protein [Treponema sp.]
MYTATAIEAKLLLFIKNKPEVTQKEIFAIFESQQQAKKAIEGCLVKNFITTTEDHKYAATPEGKNQI